MIPQSIEQIREKVKFNSFKEFIINNAGERYEEKLIQLTWCDENASRFELKQEKKMDEKTKQDSNIRFRIVEKMQQFRQ